MGSERHFEDVAKAISDGKLVPFLGAGVNLCDRPIGFRWSGELESPLRSDFLPSGSELAEYLAAKLHSPEPVRCVWPECLRPQPSSDLVRTSQEIVSYLGEGRLRENLYYVFQSKAPYTRVHEIIAGLGESLEPLNPEDSFPLVVTTNYDDLMERAYQAQGISPDVVCYKALPGALGGFYHANRKVERADENDRFCEKRPTLLKIHGTVDRTGSPHDTSIVITEDQYIDYLAREPLENSLPVTLASKLASHHFLFLGYSLRDWNLRVFLRKLTTAFGYRSWAVMHDSTDVDKKFWAHNGVDIIHMDLNEYMKRLKTEWDRLRHQRGRHLDP